MSDLRATERLLEVIGHALKVEAQQAVIADRDAPWLHDALSAITELRRRGDTLVRRDDLRAVIEHLSDPDTGGVRADSTIGEARDRLEIALGGKLR